MGRRSRWSGETVRYIGVAAPELREPVEDREEDHWARRAQYWNLRLVEGRRVRLELDTLPRDRQGRLLAYVFTQEGTFVNAWLIEFGFAEADARPPNLRYQSDFGRLEREARAKARGLWMGR
jgi:micrococcal nuclease